MSKNHRRRLKPGEKRWEFVEKPRRATATVIAPGGSRCEVKAKGRYFSLNELEVLVDGRIARIPLWHHLDLIVNREDQLSGLSPYKMTGKLAHNAVRLNCWMWEGWCGPEG